MIDAGFNPGGLEANRLQMLGSELIQAGQEVELIKLTDKMIIPCSGCWGCWVKTPGECLFEDCTVDIRRAIIHADLVLFASPLSMGYPVAAMKHLMDKLIPLILPYIELVEGENHHAKRYESYPLIGFIYGREADTDKEDLEILRDLLSRFSLNLKSSLSFFLDLNSPMELMCDQIVQTKNLKAA